MTECVVPYKPCRQLTIVLPLTLTQDAVALRQRREQAAPVARDIDDCQLAVRSRKAGRRGCLLQVRASKGMGPDPLHIAGPAVARRQAGPEGGVPGGVRHAQAGRPAGPGEAGAALTSIPDAALRAAPAHGAATRCGGPRPGWPQASGPCHPPPGQLVRHPGAPGHGPRHAHRARLSPRATDAEGAVAMVSGPRGGVVGGQWCPRLGWSGEEKREKREKRSFSQPPPPLEPSLSLSQSPSLLAPVLVTTGRAWWPLITCMFFFGFRLFWCWMRLNLLLGSARGCLGSTCISPVWLERCKLSLSL